MTAKGLTLFQDACFHYLKVEGRDCRATKQPTGPLPGRSWDVMPLTDRPQELITTKSYSIVGNVGRQKRISRQVCK